MLILLEIYIRELTNAIFNVKEINATVQSYATTASY